jgi:hypothetical protein
MRYVWVWSCVAMLAAAHAAEPDSYPMTFQSYVPSKYFDHVDGPDRPLTAAIRTQADWQSLWESIEPRMSRDADRHQPYPLPEIDFTRHTLIVIAMGREPSGGFMVAIDRILRLGSSVRVLAIATRPGSDCVVTDAFTYPITLALIPRTDSPITFEISKAAITCGDIGR